MAVTEAHLQATAEVVAALIQAGVVPRYEKRDATIQQAQEARNKDLANVIKAVGQALHEATEVPKPKARVAKRV